MVNAPIEPARPVIDWSLFTWTRMRVVAGAALMLLLAGGVSLLQYSQATDLVLPNGAPVGGDFAAFYAAAKAAAAGAPAGPYDAATFENFLKEVGPPLDRYGLTWQYPPTFYLIILPLAFLPFTFGYLLWSGGAALAFLSLLRGRLLSKAYTPGVTLLAVIASTTFFQAIITGQNGFLTASLLILAAWRPDARPIIAGLAAALLTVKPQLGVLIPIAYLAGGHWRAFGVAATGSVALAAMATAAFGVEAWVAFFQSAEQTAIYLQAGVMPLHKATTPFAFFVHAGVDATLAGAAHAILAAAAAICVFWVWRRLKDPELRLASVCAAVFFVAPYGYYYELIVLAPPVVILVQRGLRSGFLKLEELVITAMVLGPMALPSPEVKVGFSAGFPVVALVALGVWRRVAHDACAAPQQAPILDR